MTFTRPLTALEKTNKIKRIKQGVTLYKVYAFPGERSASIDIIKAAGPVKVKVDENYSFEYIPTKYGKKTLYAIQQKMRSFDIKHTMRIVHSSASNELRDMQS